MNIKKTAIKSALVAAALTATVCAKQYSGAELYTNDTWMYGKFEARMQMAAGSGTVSSMFLSRSSSVAARAPSGISSETDEDDSAPLEEEDFVEWPPEERMSSESVGDLLSPQAPRVSARAAQPARVNKRFITSPFLREYNSFLRKKLRKKQKNDYKALSG